MPHKAQPRPGSILLHFWATPAEIGALQHLENTRGMDVTALIRSALHQTYTPEILAEQDKIDELADCARLYNELIDRGREVVTRVRDSLISRADYTHDGTLRGQIVHELMQVWQVTEPEAVSMADWAVADLCVREGVLT